MAIRFQPMETEVTVKGQEANEKMVISLLRCLIIRINRVELQLAHLTGEEIDEDDGEKL